MAAIEISRMAQSAERAVELLSVLANKNRLLVLCNLLEGEMAVQPLADAVGMSQSALSQQLAKLRALRIVTTRRDGREIYYSVASQETRIILETLYAIYCTPAEEAGDVRAAVAAA